MNQKYLQEVRELTTVWHNVLNKQKHHHWKQAFCNVSHFLQDGLYGIEGRWKAEAMQRAEAIPRVALSEGPSFEKVFFEVAGAAYDHQVALQMAGVAQQMIRKTEEGSDKRWLGLVEGVNGESICDDNSNRHVALAFLLNEEVKLRRGEVFVPLYFWLKNNNQQEKAELHLNAFVRCHLILTPRHDLWHAMKSSEASTDPGEALLLELRSELAAMKFELDPSTLKKLPGQVAYGIRKRLQPEASSTPNAVEYPSDQLAAAFYNSERLSEAKQYGERWLKDAGLTPDQCQVFYLNEVEGMTLAAIAQKLNKAPGTVASHKARAREKIEAHKKSFK